MRTLDAPATPGGVLSFDFDGTLHDPAATPPVPPAFFARIQRLRQTHRILWGINTGRSIAQMIDGFVESRFPFLPDFVVAREREIHFPNAFGRWLPHLPWNTRCEKEIRRLFKNSRKLLSSIRAEIQDHTGAQWIETSGDPAGIISRTDDEMDWIVRRISTLAAASPDLGWQRNSIYLRFGHKGFQKGSSLREISAIHRLGPHDCFAIGDSHNDFEMLDPSAARMIACPCNAVVPIKEKVMSHGGLVATASHGMGVIEALDHFFGHPVSDP